MTIRKPANLKGFTIVEIMIALMIFAMVLTAMYSIWMSILKGSRAGLNAAASAQRGRIAIRTLEDVLLTAQMFRANVNYYYFYADTSTDFAELSLVARLPASFPGVGRYGDQIVRRVTFRVENGPNSDRQLVMTQAPMLATNIEPYLLVLAKDVTLFTLEFWDADPRVNDWVSEWTNTNSLPKLMRVALGLGKSLQRSSDPRDLYTRVVALPGISVPPEWQLGQPGQPGGQRGTNVVGTNFNRGQLPFPRVIPPGNTFQPPTRLK